MKSEKLPKNSHPESASKFVSKAKQNPRACLTALAALLVLLAVALYPTSSASVIGKLLRGVSSGSTSTAKLKPSSPASRKAKSQSTASQEGKAGAALRAAGDLNVERRGHAAVELADGRLLVIGGQNENGPVAEAEIYDPASQTFFIVAQSIVARADSTATKLADGRVLVIGGRGGDGLLDSTEIYDPATNSFSFGPALNKARASHSATTLADGRILIAGGDGEGSAEIFDPATQTFTLIEARLIAPRAAHAAALLQSGKALIAGGVAADGSGVQSAELFDPATLSFAATGNSLRAARTRPTLRVLPDGKVQVIGGDEEMTMEMFNAEGKYFTAYAHLLDDPNALSAILRTQTRAALIHSRNAFAVGPPKARIPDATLGKTLDRNGYSLTELPQANQAVVIGGSNSDGKFLKSTVSLSSSAATVTTDKTDYAPGDTVIITGAGWQPGETVRLVLHREPTTSPDTTLESVVNSEGKFTNSEYVILESDLNVTFTLTATGLSSGFTAQTTFTDARQFKAEISPTSVCASQSATYTITITNTNTSPTTTGIGSVRILLPTGYSDPPTIGGISAPGNTWVVVTTGGFVGGYNSSTRQIGLKANSGSDELANTEVLTFNVTTTAPATAGATTWTSEAFSNSSTPFTGSTFTIQSPPGQPTVTVNAQPTTANAGPDQSFCETSTATLAGNAPTVGTGAWTLVSGTGTITTPSSPTSGVTALGYGANIFRWTISNGTCTASTDEVTITRYQTPTTADAGPDQNLCETATATLAGNAPTVGTGAWTLVSGTGTITTPSSPTSGVTALGYGANIFRWTISNGTCTASTDEVTITRYQTPTTADAGPDQNLCETATATLAGNAPTVGTGTWTLVSGSGTITTPSSPTSGVTGLGYGANVFRWTISNGTCTASFDEVTITRYQTPTTALAGPDQNLCETSTVTLAGNAPTVGTGAWTLVSGAGTITTPSSPTSGVTGLGYGANVFRWTISNGTCTASFDEVTITRYQTPTTALAGPDQNLCETSTVTLAGNAPTVGTGTWTLVSGAGTITTPSSPTSGVTGLGYGANVFKWTISNGTCTASFDEVTITRYQTPTTALAGPDQNLCETATATLAGNSPSAGTGMWTPVSGSGTITTPSSPTSGVTGLGYGANVFRWTISNGTCTASFDEVTITRYQTPTTADAGSDQNLCETATATLAGNSPSVGTGGWTLVSGSGTITTPSSPTSGVTGLGYGANVFKWTISNGVCPSSEDTVTITRYQTPTTAAAGPDQTICATSTTLAGNTAVVGSGVWTLQSGMGTITTPGSPTSGVTGLGVGANVFRWTITNGVCVASFDEVTITRDEQPTTANAGSNQTVCAMTATLAGNAPTVGTGSWSLVSGMGTITTPSSPTSGVTGLGVGANVFRWTISNGVCAASTSEVTITRDAEPTTANAGSDQTVCSTSATLAGNAPTVGTGAWSLVSGTGTITTPSSPTSGVTGLGVGANVFRWTISNGVCAVSTSDVTITRNTPPSVTNPSSATKFVGESVTFSVTATGTGPLTYQWRKGITNLSNGGNISGATSPNLTINPVGLSDAGSYNVVVSGACSPPATSASATLTVNAIPTTTAVSVSPGSVQFSDKVTLSATVTPNSLAGGTLTGTITFKIGSITVASGVSLATAASPGVIVPITNPAWVADASYVVQAIFTSANANYAGSMGNTPSPLAVTREDALTVEYTGDTLVFTTSNSVTVNLRATVYQPGDGSLADFNLLNTGGNRLVVDFYLNGALAATANVQNSSETPGVGVATATKSVNSNTSCTIEARVRQTATYFQYSLNGGQQIVATDAGKTLVVANTTGPSANGGGWMNDPASTNGKGNFGLTVKFNKQMTNLQGNSVFVFRSTDPAAVGPLNPTGAVDIQIKTSNLIGMGLVPGTTNAVRLTAKANVQIINAVTGVVIGGFGAGSTPNFNLTVVDGSPDKYGMVVRRQDGTVYKLIGTLNPDGTVSPVQIGNGEIKVRTQ
jgi:hypothetical protein